MGGDVKEVFSRESDVSMGRNSGTTTVCGRVGLQATSARNSKARVYTIAKQRALVEKEEGKSVVRSYTHIIA